MLTSATSWTMRNGVCVCVSVCLSQLKSCVENLEAENANLGHQLDDEKRCVCVCLSVCLSVTTQKLC